MSIASRSVSKKRSNYKNVRIDHVYLFVFTGWSLSSLSTPLQVSVYRLSWIFKQRLAEPLRLLHYWVFNFIISELYIEKESNVVSYLWRLQSYKQNTEKLQIVLTAMKKEYTLIFRFSEKNKIKLTWTFLNYELPDWRSCCMAITVL